MELGESASLGENAAVWSLDPFDDLETFAASLGRKEMHGGHHCALSWCQGGSVAAWRWCTERDIGAKLRGRGEERDPWLLVRILFLQAFQVFAASPLFPMASACWVERAWGSNGGGVALSPFLGSALRCGSPWEDFHIHAAGRLGGTL